MNYKPLYQENKTTTNEKKKSCNSCVCLSYTNNWIGFLLFGVVVCVLFVFLISIFHALCVYFFKERLNIMISFQSRYLLSDSECDL